MTRQREHAALKAANEDMVAQGSPPETDAQAGEPSVMKMPVDIRSISLSTIAVVLVVLFLQYAQAVLIPVVLGTLTFYALDPLVDRLEKWRIHRTIGAALVLAAVLAVAAASVWSLRDDAVAVVEELPRAAARVRDTIQRGKRDLGPIDKLQQAAKEIDKTAAVAAGPTTPDPGGVARVQVVQPFRATDYLAWGSVGIIALASQAVMILFLAYFLLISDDLYKRKLVKISPTLSKKKITVQILDEIGNQIERFLVVQVLTSCLVAVATSLALWWVGLERPIIWGILAGILNSVPYFGPMVVTGGLMLVAYVQFENLQMAAYVAAIALVITTLEGWLLTPALMGRVASINPAAILIGIIFWSWVWGVWGLILAVPMLMMIKAVCDRIDELRPIGELLGE